MPRDKFERGEEVMIDPSPSRFWDDPIFKHKGKTGVIVSCGDYCTDHHKARYEWFANVKLRDGTRLEDLGRRDLKKADAVTRLGSLAEE